MSVFQTSIEESVSREIYETKDVLLRELMTESSFKVDAGLSLKFKLSEKTLSKDGDASVGGNIAYDRSDILKHVTETTRNQVNDFSLQQ